MYKIFSNKQIKHTNVNNKAGTIYVLSLSNCKYSLNPLNQTRINEVRLNRIRCTFKLSYNLVYGNHQAYCDI